MFAYFPLSFFRFSANSDNERSEWIECIKDSIKEHKFYDIVEAKKAALRRKSLKHGAHHDIPTNQNNLMKQSGTEITQI